MLRLDTDVERSAPLSQLERRFQIAYGRTAAEWAVADPARAAALAGCVLTPDGVLVTFFGRPHLVPHPEGEVVNSASGKPAHASIAIVLWHYLLTADGVPPAAAGSSWMTFRELPNGLFYSQAFAGHAEGLLAEKFGSDVEGFHRACGSLGGERLIVAPGAGLAPPDAAYRFQAFPRLALAVQLWEGDEEFPGRVQVLFDAAASHYLPTEDLSGVGDWLAHRLRAN
jgi:hypothetical protein